jgi:predicted amidohydrolase YtcJ
VTLAAENLDAAIAVGLMTGFGNDRLRIGHVKFYADGGMGARTAWMISPYLDGGRGMPLITPEALEASILRAQQAGLACAVHAVGDRANREIIRIYEKLGKALENARRAGFITPHLPHRIEHLQMVRPEDLRRLAALDLAVNMQPHNAVLDMQMIDDCVGPDAEFAYTFSDVLAAGVPLCFSSDAPVCDPNPLTNIQAAVTRCRENGTPPGGWYPAQRVPLDAAVAAYTRTPALVSGVGDELGSLATGKRADIIVLDRDIYSLNSAEIMHANVVMTFFDGQLVYRRAQS